MDFLTLNFDQLLYLLDDELKNTMRNFEKQKKQIISAQYGILFNQTYIYILICRGKSHNKGWSDDEKLVLLNCYYGYSRYGENVKLPKISYH